MTRQIDFQKLIKLTKLTNWQDIIVVFKSYEDSYMYSFFLLYLIGLDNLDQLVLNYNKLESLNAKWFMGLYNLKDLKLCHNKISHIDDAAFEGLEGNVTSFKCIINWKKYYLKNGSNKNCI